MVVEETKILSVDDNETNLKVVEALCRGMSIPVTSYTDPKSALEEFFAGEYDMVITDYMMPELDGIELTSAIRQSDTITPVIMVTAVGDDPKLHLRALELGATDFLTKPINPGIFKARIQNLIRLRQATQMIQNKAKLLETEVKKATAEIVEREKETLLMLGKTAEFKDPETAAHVARVSSYSKMLAEAYGLDSKMQEILYNATPFHDIGKIAIPDEILLKPTRLTPEEFDKMKTHTTAGYNILSGSKSEYLRAGGVIAFTHHEKYDGTGYPKGLRGEMIPIMGRIASVADVFDALTSSRPYKKPWSFEKTINYLMDQKGKHFDPILIDKFLENIEKAKHIYKEIRD